MPSSRPMGSIASDASAAAARSGERPPVGGVYSIGAVASMLQVPPATLRTWEERYRVVVPERTNGGHRLYARSHVEQLRFVADEVARGASAADAHRALEQRMLGDTPERGQRLESGPRILILIAERDEYSAEVIEFLLRTEGFAVEVALEADDARRRFELDRPELVIVEFLLGGDDGEALCRWLKASGAQRVLVVSELDAADRALRAGSDAFLRKPVGQLLLLSTVRDLLGRSAVLGRRD